MGLILKTLISRWQMIHGWEWAQKNVLHMDLLVLNHRCGSFGFFSGPGIPREDVLNSCYVGPPGYKLVYNPI